MTEQTFDFDKLVPQAGNIHRKGKKMPRTKTIAILVGLAAFTSIASDALARGRYFSPNLGRFMQRDPIGTANEPMARNLSASQFTQRDSTGQYADGVSLYQYVGSNPLRYHDSSGLKIEYDCCCTDAQKAAIKDAHDEAEKRLKEIKTAIDKYSYDWVLENYVMKKKKQAAGGMRNEQTAWDNYRRAMQVNITKMINKFNSGIVVECEEECSGDRIAYVYNFWSDIHFCPDFFKQNPSSQGSTFLHELSHLAARTDDKALNWTRESGWFTTGGWYAKDAADDAYWFGGCSSSLYSSKDLYLAHERWIWSKIWP